MKYTNIVRKTFLTSQNEMISYWNTNTDKEKLVLIHGNNSGANHWLDVMEWLDQSYDLLVMDLRGFGESSYNHSINSLKELALDVVELIDHVGFDSVNILGWSLGGGVAIETALILQERVNKLILSAPTPFFGFPMFAYDVTTNQLDFTKPLTSKEEIKNHPFYVLPIEWMKQSDDDQGLARLLHGLTVKNPVSDQFMNVLVDTIKKQRNLVDVDYALLAFNLIEKNRYKDLKCDTLIIAGEKDTVVLLDWIKKMQELLSEIAVMKVIEGAGHSIQHDAKEQWLESIVSFLNKV